MISNPIDKDKYPNCYEGYQYAIDVVLGDIPNCVYVIGACERFLRDWERQKEASVNFFLDLNKAEHYLDKVQKFKHVVGDWSTPENPTNNILYLPWQKFVWMNIIGWRLKDFPRFPRFRAAHVEIPRGQGKSLMASQCALYFVGLDKPLNGNQISCFATKSDQARIVLDTAREMAKKSLDYLKFTGVEVQEHKVVHKPSFSLIRAMAADSDGLDGLNDIVSIMDELHAMRRSLFDVVYSGTSKRRDTLFLCITTAGSNVESVGYTQSEYAKKVATGEVEEDTFFSIIYTIDKDDDIYDEVSWKKANPSYGVSVDPTTFAAKARKAKETPSDEPNFKIKHLNVWISEAHSYFDQGAWDKCADPTIKFSDFWGKECFVGIDLASKIDLASIVYMFKKGEKYYIFDRTYLPEDRIKKSKNDNYDKWVKSGHLIATKGEAINYKYLRMETVDRSKKVLVKSALYDPWNAISFSQDLEEEGVDVTEFRMSVQNLSEPTKNLDALIRQGNIVHNGSPLLRWCLGNVVCKEDNAGNVFPKKNSEEKKIDPIISILMCLAAWMNEKEDSSVYESRGIRFI